MELLYKIEQSELLDGMNSQMLYRFEKPQGTYQIGPFNHLKHF